MVAMFFVNSHTFICVQSYTDKILRHENKWWLWKFLQPPEIARGDETKYYELQRNTNFVCTLFLVIMTHNAFCLILILVINCKP